jgi:hypothetical protein
MTQAEFEAIGVAEYLRKVADVFDTIKPKVDAEDFEAVGNVMKVAVASILAEVVQ